MSFLQSSIAAKVATYTCCRFIFSVIMDKQYAYRRAMRIDRVKNTVKSSRPGLLNDVGGKIEE